MGASSKQIASLIYFYDRLMRAIKQANWARGNIVQRIAILANEHLEPYAGASIMLMLIDCHT